MTGKQSLCLTLCESVDFPEAAAGVLDGLLQHKGKDLTSPLALSGMMLPLESALQSYRDRAMAARKNPSLLVALEVAVQGW